jgi:hypothetical protein
MPATLIKEIAVTTVAAQKPEMIVTTKAEGAQKEFRSRMRRARQRVGASAVARLRWLVDFAQGPQEVAPNLANINAEIFEFAMRTLRGSLGAVSPSAAGVVSLRGELAVKLCGWVKEGELEISSQELGAFTRILVRGSDRGSRILSGYQGSTRGALLMACADLIAAEGGRIARCARESCGRLFVRVKRGEYCGPQCSQRVRTERYRASHSKEELSEARHLVYESKVKREKGRARKVGRRPRAKTEAQKG